MSGENTPGTAPLQPIAKPPLTTGKPIAIGLVAILAVIAAANARSLFSGNKREAPKSSLPMRPATANAQQVSTFQTQQSMQAKHDEENRQNEQRLAAQMDRLRSEEAAPGPEADTASAMTPAQRQAIYGGPNNPNAPKKTSGVSEAQAQAKQRALAREKQHQDAVNSDTVAIDFAHPGATGTTVADDNRTQAPHLPGARVSAAPQQDEQAGQDDGEESKKTDRIRPVSTEVGTGAGKRDPLAAYDFDNYEGRLYRVFEGTVFEGVVTNHIDGAFSGPILVMLTTDYYSHDHQQLLLPQGTRLIGTVQSVTSGQARKLFVVFHRAVCPDGFSLDLDKYIGLDPLGTTGLASKVDHGYFTSFAAAAAIGGLGGLAQIGNAGSALTSSAEIRNGISAQTSQEAEQILNHFLNRLPVITLKEGSRARVYIGRDLQIPSYAEHRIDPSTL